MTAAGRGGVIGVVAAVIAALFYGAWTASRPAPAPVAEAEGAVGEDGSAAAEAPAEAAAADAGADAAPTEEVAAEDAAPAQEAASDAPSEAAAPAEEAAAEAPVAAETGGEAAEGATATEEVAVAEPEAEAVAAAEATPAVAAPVPPSFDLVRVEKDGSALVAGTAAPEATLSLRVTGAEIAAVPADGQGNFVAMFNLAPSNAPRVLSLVMKLADGTEVPAEGSVVIAPTVAPEVVAGAPASATETAEPAAEAVAEAAPVVEEAPAALLVTDEGAKVLQSAESLPAELVANVTVDTITYTPEGAVQLAGRGTAERVVRIYLDNAQVGGDVAISTAGDWAVTLPEVAPGIYTLRADQLDAAGKVTSRFETPFKRETVEALAAASGGGAAEPVAPAAEPEAAEAASAATEAEAVEPAAAEAATTEALAEAPAAPLTVTVQPGFTLWKIATENLGEGIRYVQVFEANKDQIRDPDLIYPGQVFTIPKE